MKFRPIYYSAISLGVLLFHLSTCYVYLMSKVFPLVQRSPFHSDYAINLHPYAFGQLWLVYDTCPISFKGMIMSQAYCKKCAIYFVSKDARKQHYEDHDAHRGTFWCHQCSRGFGTDKERLLHWKTNRNHQSTFCQVCNKNFEKKQGLREHRRAKHLDTYCPECNRNFQNTTALTKHWEIADRHKGTYDVICNIKFRTIRERTAHFMSDPEKHFFCTKHRHCFTDALAYNAHLWDNPKHAECRCGFKNDGSLQMHYWNSKEHAQCLTCRKGFLSTEHLQSHYRNSRSHVKSEDGQALEDNHWKSDNHVNKCDSCGLGFPSASELVNHLRTSPDHFYDAACELLFESSAELHDHYAHSLKHSYCPRCSIPYSSTTELETHWKTSTQHMDTYCHRCKVHFNDSRALILHKAQAPELHNLCTTCVHDYGTEEDLLRHYQTLETHRPIQVTTSFQGPMDDSKTPQVSRYL